MATTGRHYVKSKRKTAKPDLGHAVTCEHCPGDKDREVCRKILFPETGFNCCHCPDCFNLSSLIQKEIQRNNALVLSHRKKINEQAVAIILEDLCAAELAVQSQDYASMFQMYNVLRCNA